MNKERYEYAALYIFPIYIGTLANKLEAFTYHANIANNIYHLYVYI